MNIKIKKLKEKLNDPQLLSYIISLSRCEWVAFCLGIRDVILISAEEEGLFDYFCDDHTYKHTVPSNETSLFITRTPDTPVWDDNLSSTHNIGRILGYPEQAVLDFQDDNTLGCFYCLDYKIFRLSDAEDLLEFVQNLPYQYISQKGGYRIGTMDILSRFNLLG